MMFHQKHVLIKYEFQKHRMDHQSNNNNNNNDNNNNNNNNTNDSNNDDHDKELLVLSVFSAKH